MTTKATHERKHTSEAKHADCTHCVNETNERMTAKEYIHTYCTGQGGNLTAMILSGMNELRKTRTEWQKVYDELPDGNISIDQFQTATEHLINWDA
jgi:hypothetical protein